MRTADNGYHQIKTYSWNRHPHHQTNQNDQNQPTFSQSYIKILLNQASKTTNTQDPDKKTHLQKKKNPKTEMVIWIFTINVRNEENCKFRMRRACDVGLEASKLLYSPQSTCRAESWRVFTTLRACHYCCSGRNKVKVKVNSRKVWGEEEEWPHLKERVEKESRTLCIVIDDV